MHAIPFSLAERYVFGTSRCTIFRFYKKKKRKKEKKKGAKKKR